MVIGMASAQSDEAPAGTEAAGNLTGTPTQVDVVLPGDEATTRTWFMQSDDLAVAEGDIVLGSYSALTGGASARGGSSIASGQRRKTDFVANASANTLWPKSSSGLVYVPYQLPATLSTAVKNAIIGAITDFNNNSCVRFVARRSEADYVQFMAGNGCYSRVGKVGGMQEVSLGTGCESKGTALHEMLHSLGVWHEQSRPDRNNYITVNMANVTPGMENQFAMATTTAVKTYGQYDYASVMHYKGTAFSKNGQPTMVPKTAGVSLARPADAMSPLDIAGLKQLYRCN